MNLMQSLKTVYFEKYATFSGRASRSELWWSVLFSMILLGVMPFINEWLWLIVNFALLIPNAAVACRRLHDIGRSGKWLWLFYGAIPVQLITQSIFDPEQDWTPILVGAGIWIVSIVLVIAFILEGNKGINRFGDPV